MEIGIDLGTTNSCVAYIDQDGNPQIIPNDEGGRTTPSVIFFEEDRVIVGNQAKEEALINPEDTVSYIKRHMGDKDFKYARKDGQIFSPEDLSAIILKKLKKIAEDYLGQEVDAAVITVPAYFNDAQRKATQDAANIAGLKVLKIINEPTAAALAYGVGKETGDQTIMIYDLGGGTFDVVIMRLEEGELRVLATNGNRQLGGFDFDNALLSYVIDYLEEKYDLDVYEDPYVIEDLRERVEDAKKSLSTKTKTNIIINAGGVRDRLEISQDLFNSMIADDVQRTCDMMTFTLEDAGLDWADIDKTIFVGGSSRISLVRQKVEDLVGKKPSFELNPDEVVAIGAAIQASILAGEDRPDQNISGTKIIDVNSHSLGFAAHNDQNVLMNSIMIEKNTPLPAEATNSFYLLNENQQALNIKICEGEDQDINYVTIISDTTIQLPESPRRERAEVQVTYSYDADGIIHVDVFDVTTGTLMRAVDLERPSNLTKQEILEKKNTISHLEID